MKKILILSYHFPPMNVIASQRALGYANHFKKFGFEPTIVTYDWSKTLEEQLVLKENFSKKIEYENFDNYRVIRLPVLKSAFLNFLMTKEGTFLYRFWILYAWIVGKLDVNPKVLHYSKSEKYFINNYVNNGDYDVVLAGFSPHFHLRNAYWFYKKTKTPYVLDFRDFWNNDILKNNYLPNIKTRIRDYFVSKWWRVWSSKSIVQTMTSHTVLKVLDKITNKVSTEVRNGFEFEDFEQTSLKSTDFFKIIHNGSLYVNQDIKIFLEGLKLALMKRENCKIRVEFIGAMRKVGMNSFINDPEKMLQEYLNDEIYLITERVERKESIANMLSAQILYFPTFPDSPGIYSGKLFEYLGARKNILAVPSDEDVVKEMLMLTQSGVVCDTAEEVCVYILKKYDEWMENGVCSYNGVEEEIYKFSRESQTEVLAKEILLRL